MGYVPPPPPPVALSREELDSVREQFVHLHSGTRLAVVTSCMSMPGTWTPRGSALPQAFECAYCGRWRHDRCAQCEGCGAGEIREART